MIRVKENIETPNDIKMINNVFKKHNIKLFLVGGCVRDCVLNTTPKDWDLVSEAVPSKVIEMFSQEIFVKNILLVGESFGVISLVTENDTFEIATFRSDHYQKCNLANFKNYLKSLNNGRYEDFIKKINMK